MSRECKNLCLSKKVCPPPKPYNNSFKPTYYEVEDNAWCRTCHKFMNVHKRICPCCSSKLRRRALHPKPISKNTEVLSIAY